MKHILMFQTTYDMKDWYRRTLKYEGYGVAFVTNEIDVMKLIKQNQFDLIIVDCNMSSKSFDEFYLKISKEKPGLPVIMIFDPKDSESEYADDTLKRPFKTSELITLVNHWLN